MNLIPQTPVLTGNYYCTWASQSWALGYHDLVKKEDVAGGPSAMNEKFLLADKGFCRSIDPAIRGDLIVVLDDGWDVPQKIISDRENRFGCDCFQYGSMILNEERFPSFPGTPMERLKKLSDTLKELGFAGLGLWVAPFMTCKKGEEINPSALYAEDYWRERFGWCRDADVKYIKVDWGLRCGDPDYREMMCRVAKEVAPSLKVEHSLNQGMLDPRAAHRSGTAYEKRQRYIERMQYCSDYFRTYDCHGELNDFTAITRVEEIMRCMKHPEKANCIPSVEDAVYTACGLGGTFGVMRPGNFARCDQSKSAFPIGEVVRAVNWSRISPPFALNTCDFEISDEIATDYVFHGLVIAQDAPQAISRNMPLPKIEEVALEWFPASDIKPIVLCSKNPVTKATAVYACPRCVAGQIRYSIKADVSIFEVDQYAPLGIFGKYNSLRVDYHADIRFKKIFAQDLAGSEAVEITDKVEKCGQDLVIPGDLIDSIGLTVQGSECELPGMVVQLYDDDRI